jgi:hypothetical protein
MFYWREEGAACKNGLNVYHPKDKGSAGFILKFWIGYFRVRYSKRTGQWYCGLEFYDKDGYYYR